MDIEAQIKRMKDALQTLPEVRAFYEARQAVSADPELITLDENKRKAQRAMAESMADDGAYQKNKAAYQAYEAAYDNHPLVRNYQLLREAVYFLLNQIKDILSLE